MPRTSLSETLSGFITDPLGSKNYEAKLQTYAHNAVNYGENDVRRILSTENFRRAERNLTWRILAFALTAGAAVVVYGLSARPPH